MSIWLPNFTVEHACCAVAFVGTFAAVALGSSGDEHKWKPEPKVELEKLKAGPGEITVEKALEACYLFYRKCRMPVPGSEPQVGRFANPFRTHGDFRINFREEGTFAIDCVSGQVFLYSNARRQWSPPSEPPTGDPLLTNPLQAKGYLQNLAKRIGLGGDCKVAKFECRFPADPASDGSWQSPACTIEYQPMPYGYPIRDSYDRMSLVVDPTDGAVLDYMMNHKFSYTIESHDARVKADEARERAAVIVTKYRVGVRRNSPPGSFARPTTKRVALMYVLPNGAMGAPIHRYPESPVRLRLAWVLYYRDDDEVWIDAADGKILGGIRHSFADWK